MFWRQTAVAGALVCGLVCGSAAGSGGEKPAKPLAQLRKAAAAVLKLGAIAGRDKLDVVFELAGRLAEAGQTAEALRTYEKALSFHPLALDQQINYAELLAKTGKLDVARRRAAMVNDGSENDADVARARKLLALEAPAEIADLVKPAGTSYVLVLVPMGEVDVLIVNDVAARASKALGIDVVVGKVPMKLPPHTRSDFQRLAAATRKALDAIRRKDPATIDGLMRQLRMRPDDLKDDDRAVELLTRVLVASAPKQVADDYIRQAQGTRSTGLQWEADTLVDLLRKSVKPYERPNARFLGITRLDICTPDTSFLFGWRRGNHGVLSYFRFRAEYTGETPDRARLIKRTTNQCLSSAGHVFGVARCSDPICPRAYPHSVAEHDRKSETLCPDCKAGFDKAFRRSAKKPTGPDDL